MKNLKEVFCCRIFEMIVSVTCFSQLFNEDWNPFSPCRMFLGIVFSENIYIRVDINNTVVNVLAH